MGTEIEGSARALARQDEIVISSRFPRTAIVLEVAEMADRMRFAAASLEALAANATAYEPGTLRRSAAAMVRELVNALGERVTL